MQYHVLVLTFYGVVFKCKLVTYRFVYPYLFKTYFYWLNYEAVR